MKAETDERNTKIGRDVTSERAENRPATPKDGWVDEG